MRNNLYDFLFELTEESENEGEHILCEAPNLDAAYTYLIELYGFEKCELRFLEKMKTWEGEMLGLDTY